MISNYVSDIYGSNSIRSFRFYVAGTTNLQTNYVTGTNGLLRLSPPAGNYEVVADSKRYSLMMPTNGIHHFLDLVTNTVIAQPDMRKMLRTGIVPGGASLNTVSDNGSVKAGSGYPSKVWKTDASGNPDWREDSTGAGAFDPANSYNWTGSNYFGGGLSLKGAQVTTGSENEEIRVQVGNTFLELKDQNSEVVIGGDLTVNGSGITAPALYVDGTNSIDSVGSVINGVGITNMIIYLRAGGSLSADGSGTVLLNAGLGNGAIVYGNFYPASVAYTLGVATREWASIYGSILKVKGRAAEPAADPGYAQIYSATNAGEAELYSQSALNAPLFRGGGLEITNTAVANNGRVTITNGNITMRSTNHPNTFLSLTRSDGIEVGRILYDGVGTGWGSPNAWNTFGSDYAAFKAGSLGGNLDVNKDFRIMWRSNSFNYEGYSTYIGHTNGTLYFGTNGGLAVYNNGQLSSQSAIVAQQGFTVGNGYSFAGATFQMMPWSNKMYFVRPTSNYVTESALVLSAASAQTPSLEVTNPAVANNGQVTITNGGITVGAGTQNLPSLRFGDAEGMGFYKNGSYSVTLGAPAGELWNLNGTSGNITVGNNYKLAWSGTLLATGTPDTWISRPSAGTIAVTTNMTVAGYVGVGVTSPDSKLHVASTAVDGMRINYNGNGVNYFDAASNQKHRINGATTLEIDSKGVAVNGSLHLTNLLATGGWTMTNDGKDLVLQTVPAVSQGSLIIRNGSTGDYGFTVGNTALVSDSLRMWGGAPTLIGNSDFTIKKVDNTALGLKITGGLSVGALNSYPRIDIETNSSTPYIKLYSDTQAGLNFYHGETFKWQFGKGNGNEGQLQAFNGSTGYPDFVIRTNGTTELAALVVSNTAVANNGKVTITNGTVTAEGKIQAYPGWSLYESQTYARFGGLYLEPSGSGPTAVYAFKSNLNRNEATISSSNAVFAGTVYGSAAGMTNYPTNSAAIAGVVKPGTGQASKVWKTDGSGVPDWRDDATGTGSFDPASSYNWTGSNYFGGGFNLLGAQVTSSTMGENLKIMVPDGGVYMLLDGLNTEVQFVGAVRAADGLYTEGGPVVSGTYISSSGTNIIASGGSKINGVGITNGSVTIPGTIYGNGSGLTNISASSATNVVSGGKLANATITDSGDIWNLTYQGFIVNLNNLTSEMEILGGVTADYVTGTNGVYGLGFLTNASGYYFADTNLVRAATNSLAVANTNLWQPKDSDLSDWALLSTNAVLERISQVTNYTSLTLDSLNVNTIYASNGISADVITAPTNALPSMVLDMSKRRYSTNLSGNITFTGISNNSTTNVDISVVILDPSGADRTVNLHTSWRTPDGLRAYTVTNGTLGILTVECFGTRYTNAALKVLW